MYKSGFTAVLQHVGVLVSQNDAKKLFFFFDETANGFISRDNFVQEVLLTDFEIDVHVNSIKKKLSYASIHDTTASTSKAVRQSRMLAEVYSLLGSESTKYLSTRNIVDLGAKMNFYLTDEEAHFVEKGMDTTGDGRVSEEDFVSFMVEDETVLTRNIANRVITAATALKTWVNHVQDGGVSQVDKLWNDLKEYHAKALGTPFAGMLVPQDIRNVLRKELHIRLHPYEAKLVTMLITPTGHGNVRRNDLIAFSNRGCRSLGELLALLERQFLKTVVDVFKDMQRAAGRKDTEAEKAHSEQFNDFVDDIDELVYSIKVGSDEQINATGAGAKGNENIATLTQLKDGLETALGDEEHHSLDDDKLLTLEEWAMVVMHTDHAVVHDGSFGVKQPGLIRDLCVLMVGGSGTQKESVAEAEQDENLDSVCRSLQRMLRAEAASAAVSGSGKAYEYRAPFALFDTDRNDKLSVSEFKAMLEKLRLVESMTYGQIELLVARFDTQGKGHITFTDFQKFAESERYEDTHTPPRLNPPISLVLQAINLTSLSPTATTIAMD